jgi:alkyl hydroperoxide reductase subunit AhpC
MVQLRRYQDEFAELNTEIVAVSFTGGELADTWVQQTSVPFTLIIDEDKSLYEAFGLQQSFWGSFGLKSTWYYLKNLKLPRIWGDPLQLGGDFLIDAEGVLRWAYRSEDNTDRPPIDDVLAVARAVVQPSS